MVNLSSPKKSSWIILFSKEDGAKLYRTGDIARYNSDGSIEFLGRNDNQVKIRGFRIELGEIESVIAQNPLVNNVLVKAVNHREGKAIIAYVTHKAEEKKLREELKQHVSSNLPEYMVPSFFIFMNEFPLTPNGKIDFMMFPTIDLSISKELIDFQPPTNEIEQILCNVYKEVLSLPAIGITNGFFDVGGDSIVALQIVAKAKEAGLHFEVSDIFRYQTVQELATHASLSRDRIQMGGYTPFSLLSEKDKADLPEGIIDAYPLSVLQQGMIYHSEFGRQNSTYHDVFSYHIQASPRFADFKQAFYRMVDRHPVLRTIVQLSEYSEPLQMVLEKTGEVFGEDQDISGLSLQEQESFLQAFVDTEKNQRFILETSQLIRVFLMKRSEQSFQLTLSFHHSILDGWSIGKLLIEVLENFSDLLMNEKIRTRSNLKSTYGEFIKKERESTDDEELTSYFRRYLEDSEVTSLPTSKRLAEVTENDHGLKMEKIIITQETYAKLSRLSGDLGVPLKTLLMTAHLRALGVACGAQDVLTGHVSHGRLEETDGENVLGLFLNTLPIRLKLQQESYREMISRVINEEVSQIKARRYPFAQILAVTKKDTLTDTIFNFTNFHTTTQIDELSNVKVIDQILYEKTNFSLMAAFSLDADSSNLLAYLRYHPEIYDEQRIKNLAGYYERILYEMAEDCDTPIFSGSILSPEESGELLYSFNRSYAPYDLSHPLQHWFEEQVKRTPDAIALKYGEDTMTYSQLNRNANQIAHFLIGKGIKANDFVGIALNRSFAMFEGIYGILKAGAAYVPIDPSYPEGRLLHMLEDSKIRLLLSDQASIGVLPADDISIICLDSEREQFAGMPDINPDVTIDSVNYAYMIYTSGSTGKPKGAINRHRAISNFMLWMNENYHLGEQDSVLQKTPFSFDVSLCEIFQPLMSGARVIITEPEGHKDTAYLAELIKKEAVTLVHFVPSMLSIFLEEPLIEKINSLKHVICIGEALTKEHEKHFYQKMNAQLSNLYGPAETAVVVTYWRCNPNDESTFVPIGFPVANTQMYLVDAMLNIVPKGIPGEILIGGEQVGAGYFNRDELNKEKFIEDMFLENGGKLYRTGDLGRYTESGEIEFLGRMDHQVKINGQRIELGEIEEAVRSHPAVKEALVSIYRNNAEGNSLGAHILIRDSSNSLNEEDILRHISNSLPAYMIPEQLLLLSEFPLNPSGKTDRKALPQFSPIKAVSRVAMIRPQNELEQAIHDVISTVLGVEEISVIGNLLDYGMGSLSAIRVVSKLRNTLGLDINLTGLFNNKTITELSNYMLASFVEGMSEGELELAVLD
ncbi:non-ribosomal peptide synthetase [Paenibacillus agri]|uniref:Amino acid adenylation domain-containing protein n=1 Tax=Paenibacillus agri TaxID=2744309 RepID=A0A850EPK7_9BACL|nr:non-ribosomal peptide synthetase [Paenibacillus agri]NUU60572.1 amino acid adenylation domain-containing protein [Paenibacillus agri]